LKLNATVIKGFQIASGLSNNTPYEKGTIELQKPFFKKLGLNLDICHNGTLNINITPYRLKTINSQLLFKNLKWHDKFSAETFSFSKCLITHNSNTTEAFVYYPHKETKIMHNHEDSTLEIVSAYIENIKYGDIIEIQLNEDEVILA